MDDGRHDTTTTIDWLVDGVSTGIDTDTLDSSNFTKGQSVTAQITVDDGTGQQHRNQCGHCH